jgi:hypothetical protein
LTRFKDKFIDQRTERSLELHYSHANFSSLRVMAFASWQMQKVQKVQKGPGGLVGVQESPGLSALSAPLKRIGFTDHQ